MSLDQDISINNLEKRVRGLEDKILYTDKDICLLGDAARKHNDILKKIVKYLWKGDFYNDTSMSKASKSKKGKAGKKKSSTRKPAGRK